MKVGIIGGGIAGLSAAWLLDQDHDVLLFEKNDYFGGHARTVYVDVDDHRIPIEAGFEFFNDKMFPNFCKLLKILQIPIQSYPFSYSFFEAQKNELFVLPPIKNNKIFWNMFTPSHLFTLLQLKYTLMKAQPIIKNRDCSLDLEQFINKLWVTESFKNDFFYPLVSTTWGFPQQFKSLSAYGVLAFIMKNGSLGLQESYWNDIIDGNASYIKKLCDQIIRGKLKKSAEIVHIAYNGKNYLLRQTDGIEHIVDHLIITTDAHVAHNLLKFLPHAQQATNALGNIEYFRNTIAVHSDQNFMPPDRNAWSIANVCYNGNDSAMTIYKAWKCKKTPIFRSWLIPSLPKPKSCYAEVSFDHPYNDRVYFDTQQIIAALQGINNLWFAGLHTYDISSHESALISGIRVAKQIEPNSQRLHLLCGN